MQVKLETRQLVWIRAMGSKPDGTREFFSAFSLYHKTCSSKYNNALLVIYTYISCILYYHCMHTSVIVFTE